MTNEEQDDWIKFCIIALLSVLVVYGFGLMYLEDRIKALELKIEQKK